jgi:hypothetical protein
MFQPALLLPSSACPARLIAIVSPFGIRHLLTRARATVCRGVPAPGPPAEYGGFPFRQLRKNICSYNASADAHAFATGPEQGRVARNAFRGEPLR